MRTFIVQRNVKSALKDSLGLQASPNKETTTSYAGLFHASTTIPFPLHISRKLQPDLMVPAWNTVNSGGIF